MLQGEIDNLKRQVNQPVDCGHSFEISSLREEITRYKQQISSLTIQADTSRFTSEIDRLKD